MCGIIGILGGAPVSPRLCGALRRLEYRGYDSAGIAAIDAGRLTRRRATGKLDQLEALLDAEPLAGTGGIGHTRWATHGAPTVENAHPHAAGPVMVVHNGIIENFRELRAELSAQGRNFATQTDSEVIAHLVAHGIEAGLDPDAAVAAALERLRGAFAIALMVDGEDDLMIGARRGSPLVLGYGDNEMYFGSDAFALAPLTNRLSYLDEGDWVIARRAGAEIRDAQSRAVTRKASVTSVSAAMVGKGNYRHFMLKEIHEQPEAVGHTLAAYADSVNETVTIPGDLDFNALTSLTIAACGTAFYSGLTARYWMERVGRLPAKADIASEFRYREPALMPGGLAVFISQSGETADTLAALRHCKENHLRTLAIVNVPESSIAREADLVLPTHAGPEISVASTKALTCQLTVLAALAVKAARDRGRIDAAAEAHHIRELNDVPGAIAEVLKNEAAYEHLGHDLAKARDVLYLGRGDLYPIAMEGALKLKELSYIHAEGYAAGELKHGPLALIDETVPVIVIAPHDHLFEKTVSNMQEVIARGGRVILISDAEGLARAGSEAWRTIEIPKSAVLTAPIVSAVPVQLLAYYTAVAKGTDVDQPRNLAKSVTVE